MVEKNNVNNLKIPMNLLETLFDTIPFGVDIVDEDLKIRYMNKPFLDAFGEKAIGKTCYEIYKDNQEQCEDCPLRNSSIKIGETKKIETSGVAGRKTFLITHTGFELMGKKAILEVFIDITEKKEYLDELEKFNNLTIGRELKMVELKNTIAKLEAKQKN